MVCSSKLAGIRKVCYQSLVNAALRDRVGERTKSCSGLMSNKLDKYLDLIRKAASRPGRYAYRGQKNSKWPLHSAATRHLLSQCGGELVCTDGFPDEYTRYHREALLDPAHTRGFDIDHGRPASDLQVLAKLQHFGASTGLLDFTWNPLVALWFASEDDTGGHDGKLFVVNTGDTVHMEPVPTDEEEQTIDKVLVRVDDASPSLSFWEPTFSGAALRRILRQRSVFIIGRPQIPEDERIIKTVEIEAADKGPLRRDLELLDITADSMFMDLYEFSTFVATATGSSQVQSPERYLLAGNQFYQRRHYDKAIGAYSRSIFDAPDVCETYFLCGNAKAERQQLCEAIVDYDSAINNRERLFLHAASDPTHGVDNTLFSAIYFNRANAKARLKCFSEALKDYSDAIEKDPDFSESYFNRGNTHFDRGDFEKAARDYVEAIKCKSEQAVFNRGNTLVICGRFSDALDCYKQSEGKGVNIDGSHANRIALEEIIQRIGGQEPAVPLSKDNGEIYVCVCAQMVEEDLDPWQRHFRGSIGNSGNRGGHGRPGGEGLPGGPGGEGRPGFIVRVVAK